MTVQDVLQRWSALKRDRGTWENHWQELAEVLLPRRADFTTTVVNGDKRTDKIFDGSPMQSARTLASAVDGLLKPKSAKWFFIRAQDPEINEDREARLWLEAAEERLHQAIYNPSARFLQRSGEVDLDLVVFGTGAMFISEDRRRRNLMFRSIHLKNLYIEENSDGVIDSVYLVERLTARQAAQRFGEENLGDKTKEALRQERTRDNRFRFLQAVTPVEAERWASVVIDVESEHEVSTGHFEEFPFVIPRWDTATGERYGRSPGMVALPDTNTLQEMGHTLLRAGHMAVDPPMMIPDDGVVGTPRIWPGGKTYFDAEVVRGLSAPMFPLNTGANLPLGREMQNDSRLQVEQAFFRNVLNLPVGGPEMTATEVLERREEFIRVLGPVFGRLEPDYLGGVVERCFAIMLRAGGFPEPPKILENTIPKFEYASPIERVRKRIEAAAVASTGEVLDRYLPTNPELLDNFDLDEISRDVGEAFGMPLRWIRARENRDALRQQRAEQVQAAQMGEDIERGAGVLEKMANLPAGEPGP